MLAVIQLFGLQYNCFSFIITLLARLLLHLLTLRSYLQNSNNLTIVLMALAVKTKGQGVRSGLRRELITASKTLSLTILSFCLHTHSHTHKQTCTVFHRQQKYECITGDLCKTIHRNEASDCFCVDYGDIRMKYSPWKWTKCSIICDTDGLWGIVLIIWQCLTKKWLNICNDFSINRNANLAKHLHKPWECVSQMKEGTQNSIDFLMGTIILDKARRK